MRSKGASKDEYFYIKYRDGGSELYPSIKAVRSYNKQMLKKDPNFEGFKNNKKGFFEYW